MPNFDVKIRGDYRDTTGLVLDLRPSELTSIEGTHDGSNNASDLADSTKVWVVDELVGKVIYNLTDESYGRITANTATTVVAVLAGGSGNDWDTDDAYTIQGDVDGILRWENVAPAARIVKPEYSGTHDGGNNSAILMDSNAPWTGMNLVGMAVYNLTDNSLGWITANDDDSVTATLAGGTDNDWDTTDAYQIADPRFGDAYSDVGMYQPAIRTIDGVRLAEFFKDLSTRLYVPTTYGFPLSWWTIAVEVWNGTNNTIAQMIIELDGQPNLGIWRLHPDGDVAITHGHHVFRDVGNDHPDGLSILQGNPPNDAIYWNEGVSFIEGPYTFATAAVTASDNTVWIGGSSDSGGSDYFDGRIRSIRVWCRPMSEIEIGFILHSLSSVGTDYSPTSRSEIALRAWTDNTGAWPRVTGQLSLPERFLVTSIYPVPYGNQARIQLAASVNGKVRPDIELDGELFRLGVLECPDGIPAIEQDSGWSAIFDLVLDSRYPGHYTCIVTRENGGSVIIHFDLELSV